MRYLILSIFILLSTLAIGEPIQSVDIYAPCGTNIDTNYSYNIKVHYMGCQEAISNNLSSSVRVLKHNTAAIKAEIKNYMESHKKELQKVFNNELQNTNNKVKRFPSVVINNKYVIYGTDDFRTAKAQYYEYMG